MRSSARPRSSAPSTRRCSRSGGSATAPWNLSGAPADPEPWYECFVIALAKYGRITLAAATARVHGRVAYTHMAKNRALSDEVEAARAHYRSGLEYGLAHQFHVGGNVLVGFGALKGELPGKYIEKRVIVNMDATGELPPAALAETLARMLEDASAPTASLLRAPGTIVRDLPALPEGDATR